MDTFEARINLLIKKLGGKTKASKKLDISTEQIRRWINGVSAPGFFKMQLLCDLTDTSLDWLANGKK